MQPPTLTPEIAGQPRAVTAITIGGEVGCPAQITDLDSFRRWARSEDYPRRGWFAYLNGTLWVDLSMEQLFSHNQVKGEFAITLGTLVKQTASGRYFHDRALLSNPTADLSTEPDGLFYSWETLRSGRIRLVEGSRQGHVELEGTPDMVLEVVSDSSVAKDNEILPALYLRAGTQEYWLVDARGPRPLFTIFRHTSTGYVRVVEQDGWLTSPVFDRQFRFVRIDDDPTGQPQYSLLTRLLTVEATRGTTP